jgi:hypothetical protein
MPTPRRQSRMAMLGTAAVCVVMLLFLVLRRR